MSKEFLFFFNQKKKKKKSPVSRIFFVINKKKIRIICSINSRESKVSRKAYVLLFISFIIFLVLILLWQHQIFNIHSYSRSRTRVHSFIYFYILNDNFFYYHFIYFKFKFKTLYLYNSEDDHSFIHSRNGLWFMSWDPNNLSLALLLNSVFLFYFLCQVK